MTELRKKAKELYNLFRDDPVFGRKMYPYPWEYFEENSEKLKLQSTIDWWEDATLLVQIDEESKMNYKTLKTEIADDPLTRGYAAMSNAEVVTSLKTVNRERQITSVDSAFIFERLDLTEVAALDVAQTARLDRVLSLGSNILVQGQAKNELLSLFGGGSATITALASAIIENISRFEELGLSGGLSEQIVETAITGAF